MCTERLKKQQQSKESYLTRFLECEQQTCPCRPHAKRGKTRVHQSCLPTSDWFKQLSRLHWLVRAHSSYEVTKQTGKNSVSILEWHIITFFMWRGETKMVLKAYDFEFDATFRDCEHRKRRAWHNIFLALTLYYPSWHLGHATAIQLTNKY